MKENIKLEIERSLHKIGNIKENVLEIQTKIAKLEAHIKNLENSLKEEEKRVELIGLRGFSKDPEKPDTEESLKKKEEYNAKLKTEKDQFIHEKLQTMQLNPTVQEFLSDMFKI